MSTSTSAVKVTATASARAGQYEIKDITLAQTAKVQSSIDINDINNKINADGLFKIKYNNNDNELIINYDSNTTYKDIITQINTGSNGQLKAYYSEVTKRITIETTKTGIASNIEIKDITGTNVLGLEARTYNGTDASFMIKTPGAADYVQVQKSNNTFTIDGLTFTLNESTTDTIKFSIGVDSKPAIDKIKEFVEKYNELVDKINKRISEKGHTHISL